MLEPWPVQAEAGPSTSADNGLPHRPDEYLLHRPMFSLTIDEFHRQEQLMAQRDTERLQQEHDDQASDAMSQVDAPLAGSLLADVPGSSHDRTSMPGPSTGIAGPSQAVLGPFDGPTATQQSNQTHQPLFVRPLFELTPEQVQQAMQLHAEQARRVRP